MLPPLRLLTLLLSLPRQGDGTPHHHHDEDDQGLLEARLFQVTAGGNIRGGKKKLYKEAHFTDIDAQLSSTLEAVVFFFDNLTFFAFIIGIKSKLILAPRINRESHLGYGRAGLNFSKQFQVQKIGKK